MHWIYVEAILLRGMLSDSSPMSPFLTGSLLHSSSHETQSQLLRRFACYSQLTIGQDLTR